MNIVKDMRTLLGLSMSEFSRQAGFNNVQQVYTLEYGKANVGLNLLNKMVSNLRKNGHKVDITIAVHVNDKAVILR